MLGLKSNALEQWSKQVDYQAKLIDLFGTKTQFYG